VVLAQLQIEGREEKRREEKRREEKRVQIGV
jgi:hypothetical protein